MQFIPLTYGTLLLSMSEDFYRWQCHEETQEIILDFITNYHFSQILMLQFTQSPPCPQVVLPPTARWLELLPISRRSLKLETFSLLQVGKMTSLHILSLKVIINIISPFCNQTQLFMFSEERSCSCQCEAEFPTFREDTSACVETVQGGYYC